MRRKILLTAASLVCLFLSSVAMAAEYTDTAVEPGMPEEIVVFETVTEGEEDPALGYIGNVMPHRRILQAARPSGLRLAEPERNLYIALRTSVSRVAAGESGKTEFGIPYGEVFQNTFTAEELGIEDIVVDGKITEDAKTKAMTMMILNRNKLQSADAVHCLITDSPYELYWYDKAEGHGTRINYATTVYSATGETITVKGNIVIQMSVSKDYAVQYADGMGGTVCAEYEVDTRYGTSAQMAAENAQTIINANKDKDDDEKLIAYRDAICALTDYNNDTHETDPYGDPWQIIWVFDGKPNTKVVCEGYAKAFQYLCDLGTKEATVITAQGQTSGPHMWNIVSIGGHNYLVDMTMYDLGYDLFLKGYSAGDTQSGYTVDHGKGTVRYTYNADQIFSEDELTLYTMDYSEWKETVERVPDIRLSSDVIYPGYAAVFQIINENAAFMPSTVQIHRVSRNEAGEITEDNTEELPIGSEYRTISEEGEYYFTVVRDGAKSEATESVTVRMEELPAGDSICLPTGSEIRAEAFAGNESITLVEAEDCIIRKDAFAGSNTAAVKLAGDCVVEAGAFEDDVIAALDEMKEWMEDYRFVIKE